MKNTTEAWLAELNRLSIRQDQGLTSREWSEKLGISVSEVKIRLAEAHRRGWLKSGRRTSTTISGISCQVPVYLVSIPKGKT